MTFISDLEEQKYDDFVKNHPLKSHFLQSYAWGTFAKKEKHLYPHYVGLIDEKKKLVAATLLLEKKLPLGYSYFYAPRGFVMDMSNEVLLKQFVEEIKKYIKKYKAIFLKVDPDLILKESNYLEEVLPLPYDGKKILENMQHLGFRHLGFTQNFELFQPRFTFRIDMKNQSLEEIRDHFSKTTKQRIKKAEEEDVEVRLATREEIDEFYKLMKVTENRKDFVSHDLSYYETLFDIWNEKNSCNIFLGIVDLEKMITKRETAINEGKAQLQELEKIENPSKTQNTKKKEITKRLEKLKEDHNKYKEIEKEYGNKIILNAHFILEYGNKAWVLYAGNHNILSETGANYKTYQEHIEYCYRKGIEIYDQFGTIGDLRKDNPLLGLHEFKKKFGGDYIEFIGEFDFVAKRGMYFVFTKLVPLYRTIIKKKAKQKNRGIES